MRVEDFGAIPSAAIDNSDAFDRAIVALKSATNDYTLSGRGQFGIGRTLDLDSLSAVELDFGPITEDLDSSGLVYIGVSHGPIVRHSGRALTIKQLSIQNDSAADNTGILFEAEFGYGSGKNHIQNLSVRGCKVGIDIGGTSAENCDESLIDYLIVRECEVGVQLNHPQVMGWTIQQYRSYYNGEAIEINAGGGLVVNRLTHINEATSRVLHVTGDGVATATNNGHIHIGHLKLDGNNGPTQILNVTGPASGRKVTFDQPVMSSGMQQDPRPTFYVNGGTHVEVRGGVMINDQVAKLNGPANDPNHRFSSIAFTGTSFMMTQAEFDSRDFIEVVTPDGVNGYLLDRCFVGANKMQSTFSTLP